MTTDHEHAGADNGTGATADASSEASDKPQETIESSHTQDAPEIRDDAVMTSDEEATEEAQGQRQFGKLSPSEAAKRRWEQHREREAARTDEDADEASDAVTWVRVPVRIGEIVKRLARDAKGGDVQAARELRAYLTEYKAEEGSAVSDLDRRTRRRLLDVLLAQLADEDAASPEEGTVAVASASAEGATPASAGVPVRAS